MTFGSAVAAALLAAALPAAAQAQEASRSAPPAEAAAIRQAAAAFGQCIAAGMQGLGAAPEADAAAVLGACSAERQRLEQAAEAMIATLPAEQQGPAREQLRSQLADADAQIADAIRRQREAAAAPGPSAE